MPLIPLITHSCCNCFQIFHPRYFKNPQACLSMSVAHLFLPGAWGGYLSKQDFVGVAIALVTVSGLDASSLRLTSCSHILAHVIKEIHYCYFDPYGAMKEWPSLSKWKGQSFLPIFILTQDVSLHEAPQVSSITILFIHLHRARYPGVANAAREAGTGWVLAHAWPQAIFKSSSQTAQTVVLPMTQWVNFPFTYGVLFPGLLSAHFPS